MSMIEGIGDEVIQFFVFVFIMLMVFAAWQSTRVRDSNLVLILLTQWLHRTIIHIRVNRLLLEPLHNINIATNRLNHRVASRYPRIFSQLNEEESSTVEENSPENNTVHFQNRVDQVNEPSTTSSENQLNNVKIKLKFIDSSVKTTEASLNEKLGEFKRRIFTSELSQGKTVVVIFRGRILKNNALTLRACKFFDDCVVHCLIRDPPAELSRPRDRAEDSFSTAVLSCLIVLLSALWYIRFQYSGLFTLPATAGLFALTVLFVTYLASSQVLARGEPRFQTLN